MSPRKSTITNPLVGGPDDTLLEEIRSRFQYAHDQWADIRQEAAKDMRYVAGDPWKPEDRKAREAAARPCLSLDELNQHFNQVINGVRANKRAIKFSPVGNGATDQSAEWYADKTREIEYRSHAQMTYTTAFQDAVHRSYGYGRLKTKFESDRSFNQDLWLEPVPNPDMVLPDPDALRPDSSDMKYCFVYETRTHDEFVREYPDATVTNFPALISEYPLWITDDKVVLAEYWTIRRQPRRLLLLHAAGMPAPVEVFEDELAKMPEGARVLKQRVVDYPKVWQYLTNGVEILQTTEWPGKYIPIASCYGMVLWVEGKKQILSMTRLARDPYMLYCYYRTCEAELVGMTPKTPYMAFRGQLNPDELTAIEKSLHEPVAVLTFGATTEETGQQVLPPVQRQPYDPPIQALEIGAESARRAIQSAMGSSPLPSQAQRRNEKSGVALQQIEDTAQRGSFHFNDHYDDMIRHFGVMIEDLMDKVYDSPRDVGIRKPNDTAEITRINDQAHPESINTKGDHQVTVSTGPSFDSQREAESAFADMLMNSPFAPQIADLAVKLKGGGPVLDEIADRLTPPQFRQASKDGKPSPADVAHLQGQLQQVGQAAQQMKQALDTKQVEAASAERIAAAEFQSKERIADMESRRRAETAIAVAEIGSKSKLPGLFLEERDRLGVQQENAADRTHEAMQSEADRQHELGMAQLGHQQALEQGAQSAALQPPPVPQGTGV